MDWTRLSPDQFEEFCTHLLYSENYTNITRIGGPGDRGRDVVAERHEKVMTGKTRVEKWILQAKRYTSAAPTPDDLQNTITWAEAHKPFGIIFAFPHRPSPATHDWLTATEEKRGLRILLLDVDYLEEFLTRSAVARHRFFGEPMPSLERTTAPAVIDIVQSATEGMTQAGPGPTLVYTAGKMDSEAKRGGTAQWRIDLEAAIEPEAMVKFLHPELVGCDHTGIAPAQTIEADRYLLARSHVVVGYLTDSDMPGTIVELMAALQAGKDVGIFVDHRLVHPGGWTVYRDVYKTKHGCDCMFYDSDPDFAAKTPFWFFLGYVRQTYPNTLITLVDEAEAAESMAEFVGFHDVLRTSQLSRPPSDWF